MSRPYDWQRDDLPETWMEAEGEELDNGDLYMMPLEHELPPGLFQPEREAFECDCGADCLWLHGHWECDCGFRYD